MSHRGRGGEVSSSGKTEEVGRSPIREVASPSSATDSSAEPISAGSNSAALGETSNVPISPTTPTLEAATTGTDSEHSYEHERKGSETSQLPPRQVIAVSVSKGPSAFFNLARKFLVTDEVCDLSALEGAIVSAVDAAHLLERSKIATIIRIHTSYVAVEPKKRKDQGPGSVVCVSEEVEEHSQTDATTMPPTRQSRAIDALATEQGHANLEQSASSTEVSLTSSSPGRSKASAGTLRRARIIITVQRTEAYKKWLEENPIQDVISGEDVERI